jgi:uncharacterized protein
MPTVTYFKPARIPLRDLEEVCFSVEEIEAIRLKNIEDLEQEQGAEKKNISRSTFVRVLEAARKKLAEALIQGKAIRIEGGHFEMAGTTETMLLHGAATGPGRRKRSRRCCGQNSQNAHLKENLKVNEDIG